jgi:hypothetical protein
VIFAPPIIALTLGSFLVSSMLLYASLYGIQVLKKWDIKSGSELQLVLERKTYLISTIVSYAFGFQLLSLFLFIYTADDLCKLFVGAMCAAGTLKVNSYGYPALILKIFNFIVAGTWLIVNYTDNRAHDYPLIEKKYLLLLIITPFILAETALQFMYFLELHPNVITSCCGSLFSAEAPGVGSSLASFPSIPMKIVFYGAMTATLISGIYFYRKTGIMGYVFSMLSACMFIVSIAALISFISLYFYELPTHHCPFCILQQEYNYIGYVLYVLLLTGAVSGMGVGALMPFRTKRSLEKVMPSILRKLTLASMVSYGMFVVIATYQIIFSNFRLEGY